MTTSWRERRGPARALASATSDAVAAGAAAEPEAFDAATATLAGADAEHVRLVLGGVLRSLLEEQHADGLDGDDVAAVVEACARGSAWCPDLDPEVLVVVLAGALGVHEDEPRPLAPLVVARHAALLAATLLTASARPVDAHLDAALADVARAQTVELP